MFNVLWLGVCDTLFLDERKRDRAKTKATNTSPWLLYIHALFVDLIYMNCLFLYMLLASNELLDSSGKKRFCSGGFCASVKKDPTHLQSQHERERGEERERAQNEQAD